jgi:geranylgeranyl transferase type-2 subunit beta
VRRPFVSRSNSNSNSNSNPCVCECRLTGCLARTLPADNNNNNNNKKESMDKQAHEQAHKQADKPTVVHSMPGESACNSAPPFYKGLHCRYITQLAATLDQSFEGALMDHLRMSGVYWSLTGLSLLLPSARVMEEMRVYASPHTRTTTSTTSTTPSQAKSSQAKSSQAKSSQAKSSPSIVDWIFTCFDETTGGFGGNAGQDAHLLYTLSALQILALVDALQDPRLQFAKERVVQFCGALQQADGSFAGDSWGEIDSRFSYCALQTLALLQSLDRVHVPRAASYILTCRNLDGGFGCVPGAESHAGRSFLRLPTRHSHTHTQVSLTFATAL